MQNADQQQHQNTPYNYEYSLTILADNRSVARNMWSAIEKLRPAAEEQNAAKHKDDQGEHQCDAQRGHSNLCNRCYHHGTVRVHVKRLPAVLTHFYDASGGFSDPAEGGIATPSSGIDTGRQSLADDRDAASTEQPWTNSVKKIKEARVKPKVTIEYCTD
jgi:hypothetical protein